MTVNGTVTGSYQDMSAFTVFRDFINSAFGRNPKPFNQPNTKPLSLPVIERVSELNDDDDDDENDSPASKDQHGLGL